MVTDIMTTMIRKFNTAVITLMISQLVMRSRQPRTFRRTIRTKSPDAVPSVVAMTAVAMIAVSVKAAVAMIVAAMTAVAVAETVRRGAVGVL